MAVRRQTTTVMMSGVNISKHVCAASIHRAPDEIDTVDLTFHVDRFEWKDGELIIHLDGPPNLTLKPVKRIIL